jgi:hypothetical protein
MRWMIGPTLTLASLLAAAGCATDERQWMKLNAKYTTEEFRRDHAACTKRGKLNDACMRDHGWVAVNPTIQAEKPRDPYQREIGAPYGRRSGY